MTDAAKDAATDATALELRVPGDKSIGHRALIVASIAPSAVRITGLPDAADVRSTAAALSAVGADIRWPGAGEGGGQDVTAVVTPPGSWRAGRRIDCGNSGTTARLLTGLFAGLGLEVTIDGDVSLRRRPMDRVVYPLQAMGAKIEYLEADDRLPIRLAPRATGSLRVLRYRSRVASAQVKSALVLAALMAGVEFEMWEPGRSRDHTERLLARLGAPIEFGPEDEGAHLHLAPGAREEMVASDLSVPGDPSSAAFLLVAGVLGGRKVSVEGVLLNETRTAYLEVLEELGVDVEIEPAGEMMGEPVGRITARPGAGPLVAATIGPGRMAALIDEIPVLSVLASRAVGVTEIRGAEELRVKETDRLSALADNLAAVGIEAEERDDGLAIRGRPEHSPAGAISARGDHRIAMAFGALSAVPGAAVEIDDPDCAAVSYPGFWADLERIRSGRSP